VIGGQTITSIPSVPTTVVANGQTFILSSGSIITPSTTIAIFGTGSQGGSLKPATIGDITLSVGPSITVISGKTYTMGPSAIPTTVFANGQAFILSSGSIITPSTTIAIFSLTLTTMGDITLSVGPSIAVISGKTYTIGPSAIPTTTVVNGETISIGPGGIGFPTTTIAPSLFTGGAVASRGLAKFSGSLSALFLVLVGLL
jgi:hypothetical protein